MGFFDIFKRQRPDDTAPQTTNKAPEYKPLEKIVPLNAEELLPFPYRTLDKSLSDDQLIAEWKGAAREEVQPLLILEDEQLMELLSRTERLHPQDADKPFIRERYQAEAAEFLADPDNAPLIGRKGTSGPAMDSLFPEGASPHAPLILAEVPCERPWGIFRMIHFGGWNACPDAEKIADFCQMIHEEFGAVPIMVTGDTLVLLPGRIPSEEEAFDLALRIWSFCPDMILQEYGTVHALADALTHSKVWRFQWD